MKAKFFTLLIAALSFSTISFAKLFRVGYQGLSLSGVDFTTLQAAHDAANAGDTIQVYGDVTASAFNGTKKLIIIGFGYNFDVNTDLQAIGTDAPSKANLTFSAGSDGSVVSGITGQFNVGDVNSTNTPVSNITFQRCNGSFYFYNYIDYGAISNIKILSCVVGYLQFYYGQGSDKPVSNLQIYNCILSSFNLIYATGTTVSISNCVTPTGGYGLNLYNAGAVVKNCIIGQSYSTQNVNTVYDNCFFSDAQPATLPSGSNNHWGQDWGVLFNRLGGTDDAPGDPNQTTFAENYYILKSGSPAIKGGLDASNNPTDCGIYGGEAVYKYKLSGVPAVPAIYKLSAPSNAASSNPYNITISVRSNN